MIAVARDPDSFWARLLEALAGTRHVNQLAREIADARIVIATVTAMHCPQQSSRHAGDLECAECGGPWPCRTAQVTEGSAGSTR